MVIPHGKRQIRGEIKSNFAKNEKKKASQAVEFERNFAKSA